MAGDEWNRWVSGENRSAPNGGAEKTGGFRGDDVWLAGSTISGALRAVGLTNEWTTEINYGGTMVYRHESMG